MPYILSSRCGYGMVPLGAGVAYCAGDEWSEVLTDVDETDKDDGNDFITNN